jgi:hypothetical protein
MVRYGPLPPVMPYTAHLGAFPGVVSRRLYNVLQNCTSACGFTARVRACLISSPNVVHLHGDAVRSRLDNAAGSGFHLTPGGLEFDEQVRRHSTATYRQLQPAEWALVTSECRGSSHAVDNTRPRSLQPRTDDGQIMGCIRLCKSSWLHALSTWSGTVIACGGSCTRPLPGICKGGLACGITAAGCSDPCCKQQHSSAVRGRYQYGTSGTPSWPLLPPRPHRWFSSAAR